MMKKLNIIIFVLLIHNVFAQNQPILSGTEGFENWKQSEAGEMPQFWDGFNKQFFIDSTPVDSVITVTKDSIDPKSGKYSVKLKSFDFYGVPIQGLLTHGNFNVDFLTHEGEITGGVLTHKRPLKFKGYYKYFPANYDKAAISIFFMKGAHSEIIGEGRIEITQTVSSWSEFTIDIQYYTDEKPDTMNILFTTSSDPFNIQVGSVLEIDNIWLEETTSNSAEISNINLNVYPNPANEFVRISGNNISGKKTIKILNSVGEVVTTKMLFSTLNFNEDIDISNLHRGIYFVELNCDKKTAVKKLVIY